MKSAEELEGIVDVQEVDLDEAAESLMSRREALRGVGKKAVGLAMMVGLLTVSSQALVACPCTCQGTAPVCTGGCQGGCGNGCDGPCTETCLEGRCGSTCTTSGLAPTCPAVTTTAKCEPTMA